MLNYSSVKLTPHRFFKRALHIQLNNKNIFYFPYLKCFIVANKLISGLCHRQIVLPFYTFVFSPFSEIVTSSNSSTRIFTLTNLVLRKIITFVGLFEQKNELATVLKYSPVKWSRGSVSNCRAVSPNMVNSNWDML